MRELLRSRPLRLAALVAGAALGLWLLHLARHVMTPFAVAFALAYFLNPPVNALERVFARGLLGRRLHPRTVAVGVLATAVVATIVAVLLIAVPVVSHQVVDTVHKLPEYATRVRERVEPALERLNVQYPEVYEEARARVAEAARGHLPQILSPLTHVLQTAFSSLLSFVLLVLHVAVIPVFTLYLLNDMGRIQQGARELVPHRFRDYAYSRAVKVDALLSAFVRGQITVCLMLGTFYAIALSLVGVPMGLLVGYSVAFFNLIPFMATALGLPLVMLLTFVDSQSPEKVATVVAIFFFGHFVESHFITPRVVGERLGLHPVVIMLAVLVGGTLVGFVGMLVAVPLTAALSVFWTDLHDFYLGSEFYQRGSEPESGT